uniref:Hypoxia up-regulated protein 1 n=1 Tax=Panagrolaimus davidi TaxID=227884 RepID=A0A914QCX7_9BILA
MVLHVGIDAHSGNIATYNNITKETKNLNIEYWLLEIQWYTIYPIIEIYEKIKNEVGGDFGYACVVIKDNEHDDIRKRFIKKGEEYGFKKVLIINSFTEMYLDYFITLKEKPKTVEADDNKLQMKCMVNSTWYCPLINITPEMLRIGEISFETYDIPQEPLINPNINAIGIDLGMTRCCAAVNRNDRFELVAIDNSERQLPSYVSFKEKDPNCGQLVINQLEFYASSTVFDIKRIIGRNINEIDKNPAWPFEVIRIDSKPLIYMKSCGNVLMKYPEEVTAVLLKQMKKKVEEFQGSKMDEVVITIPAGFNQNQKIATHVAADLAGFKTVHLLAEPIAASIAYFVDRPIPSNFNVLLFDLGGGTLDLCIFKVENNKLKVIANDGDSNLGGRDFDNLLFQHFEKILETKYKIAMNEKSKYRLMLKCVEIKHTLSAENEASLDVDVFNPEIEEFLKITRQEFEQFSATLLLRLHECLKQTFAQAKIYASDINKVLLVGGGCRMPMIQLFLRKRFPKAEHICAENPDEMVAIGAAYYSSFLMSNNGGGYCNIM